MRLKIFLPLLFIFVTASSFASACKCSPRYSFQELLRSADLIVVAEQIEHPKARNSKYAWDSLPVFLKVHKVVHLSRMALAHPDVSKFIEIERPKGSQSTCNRFIANRLKGAYLVFLDLREDGAHLLDECYSATYPVINNHIKVGTGSGTRILSINQLPGEKADEME